MYTQFFYGWLLPYKAANDIIHNNTLNTFYSHSFQSLLVACSTPQTIPIESANPAGKVISVCFLIIGTRGQGFIEIFFESLGSYGGLSIFSFPFDCRAKLFQCSPRESDDLLGSEQKIEPQLLLSA